MEETALILALIGIAIIIVGFVVSNKFTSRLASVSTKLASIIISFLMISVMGSSLSLSLDQSVAMGRFWGIMLIIFIPSYLIYRKTKMGKKELE